MTRRFIELIKFNCQHLTCTLATLGIIGFTVLPSVGQISFNRFPTSEQVRQMIRAFRSEDIPLQKRIRQCMFDCGSRSVEETRQINLFVDKWSKKDSSISPFLGRWINNNHDISIYPSPVKGRVCILEALNSGITKLSLGSVYDGKIFVNQGYSSNTIFTKEERYLIKIGVYSNELRRIALSEPRPLSNLSNFSC